MAYELVEALKISKTTAHEHLVKLGYDVWISHNLTEKNLIDRICDLYKRNEIVFEAISDGR